MSPSSTVHDGPGPQQETPETTKPRSNTSPSPRPPGSKPKLKPKPSLINLPTRLSNAIANRDRLTNGTSNVAVNGNTHTPDRPPIGDLNGKSPHITHRTDYSSTEASSVSSHQSLSQRWEPPFRILPPKASTPHEDLQTPTPNGKRPSVFQSDSETTQDSEAAEEILPRSWRTDQAAHLDIYLEGCHEDSLDGLPTHAFLESFQAPLKERTKNSALCARQNASYTILLEERLAALEKMVEALAGEKTAPVEENQVRTQGLAHIDDLESVGEETRPSQLLLSIRRVELEDFKIRQKQKHDQFGERNPILDLEWEDFMAKRKPKHGQFHAGLEQVQKKAPKNVIDIAVQTSTENPQARKTNSDLPSPYQRHLKNNTQSSPQRIRINSIPLLKMLEQLSGESLFYHNQERPLVFLRPFKFFVKYEKEIREFLNQLESQDREGSNEKRAEADYHSPDQSVVGELNNTNDSDRLEAIEHLTLLVEVLDTDLGPTFQLRQQIKDRTLKTIAFHDLWHLFQPGDVIRTSDISDGQGRLMTYKIISTTGGRPHLHNPNARMKDPLYMHPLSSEITPTSTRGETPFYIDCYFYGFDSKRFGPVHTCLHVDRYDGDKPITSLPLFPSEFSKDWKQLKSHLIQRGRKYASLATSARMSQGVHQTYRGWTLDDLKQDLDSEVIVDFEFSQHANVQQVYNKAYPPNCYYPINQCYIQDTYQSTNKTHPAKCLIFGFGAITEPNQDEVTEYQDPYYCTDKECFCNDVLHNDGIMESRLLQAEMSRLPTLTEDLHSDDEALLCPCELFAFVLRTRLWSVLHVDKLNNLEDTTNGFDGLVLPAGHKETLLAMFECHIKGNDALLTARNSIDVVRGKGEGLVILLHGEPGVGKTSTAECIARYTRRPLLPMACGDLGQSPEVVEVELMRILGLAQLWGCVLLLDEADVFLQRRDKGTSLSRNMIVSVFLRVLEYYKGILILTTNRVGTFDPAFKSRIHTALYYQRLDKRASLAVWKMHLDRLEESSAISVNRYREDILEFARDHYQKLEKSKATWNGRQIRNAFQTAIALAEYKSHRRQEGVSVQRRKKPRLTVEEFEKVAEASASFDLYLRRVYRGYDDGHIARDNKERVDDEEPDMKPLFAVRRRRVGSDTEVEKLSDETGREDTESANTGKSDFEEKKKDAKGKKKGSKGKKNGS